MMYRMGGAPVNSEEAATLQRWTLLPRASPAPTANSTAPRCPVPGPALESSIGQAMSRLWLDGLRTHPLMGHVTGETSRAACPPEALCPVLWRREQEGPSLHAVPARDPAGAPVGSDLHSVS